MTICYNPICTMISYHLKSKHKTSLTIVFLTFSSLLLAAPAALAQDETNHVDTRYTASSTFNLTFTLFFLAFIILFIAVAFLIVLFSFGGPFSGITERRASDDENGYGDQWVDPTEERSGLDRSVLDTFPIMRFSEVRGLINHSIPECAVCLSEYNDSDTLRILPGCCHVFHPECIDNWLTNHDICPVCRASLSNPNVVSIELRPETGIDGLINSNERRKMWMSMKGADRFTVKLPEHVLRDIRVERGHKISASIAGSGYQGAPTSSSGRIWAFIRTFSSKRTHLEVAGGSKSVRLSTSSLCRNLTLGRNSTSSVKDTASVRSGSVQNQTDVSVAASGTVPAQTVTDLVMGSADKETSGIVPVRGLDQV